MIPLLTVAVCSVEVAGDAPAVDEWSTVRVVAVVGVGSARTTTALDQDRIQVPRTSLDLGRIDTAGVHLDIDRGLSAERLSIGPMSLLALVFICRTEGGGEGYYSY